MSRNVIIYRAIIINIVREASVTYFYIRILHRSSATRNIEKLTLAPVKITVVKEAVR